MNWISLPLLVILILLQITPNQANVETKLLNKLRENYAVEARPVKQKDNPVNVTFGFELVSIITIIESSQTIMMKIWIRMSWKNEFLTWDPRNYSGITSTRLSPSDVWTPDLYLMEDIHDEISSGPDKYKTQVILMSDGQNYWNVPSIVSSSCPLDVTNFPYDRQNCTLKYISWSYDQKELDIKEDKRAITTKKNYIASPAWTLHNVTRKVVSQRYACCVNPYVHIEYKLILHREPRYYFYNIVLPCLIQMMIILFTFFLPPDSGERIGVAITVLLVFAVYLEVLNANLPKTSTSSPALSRFYLTAMSGSAFSIIATCFVLVVHFKGAEKGVGPMPKWVKTFFLEQVGVFLLVRKNLRTHNDEDLLALEKHESYMELKCVDNEVYKENKDHVDTPGDANMRTLVEEVKVITALISDQNLQDEIEEEWQTLGKVFDRLFFIVFFLFFVISSLYILYPVARAHMVDYS